mgnify:CR=1 FL=1
MIGKTCFVSDLGLLGYIEAWAIQNAVAKRRAENKIFDSIIFVQHPHTYTLGRRGKTSDILVDRGFLDDNGIDVYEVDRGGEVTYHGPGQIIAYPVLDVKPFGGALAYIHLLEKIVIDTIFALGLDAYSKDGCSGVWVGDAKIASLGVKISRGITTHGFSLNINTDLDYYKYIIPCGTPDEKTTSLRELLGHELPEKDVLRILKNQFGRLLGTDIKEVDLADLLCVSLV